MKVNPNILFVVAACAGALTVAGVVVLDALRVPDTSGYLTGAGTILTTILGFGSLLASNSAQSSQQQTIEAKVNGNLSQALALALNPTGDASRQVAQISAATGVAPAAPEQAQALLASAVAPNTPAPVSGTPVAPTTPGMIP